MMDLRPSKNLLMLKIGFIPELFTRTEMKNKNQDPFFYTQIENEIVSVWLGPPDDPESEYVMSIHRFYIPELIHTLRNLK